MGAYECKYCHAIRKHEHTYRINNNQSVLDIQYFCGTVLKIFFPEGRHEWYKHCSGITSTKVK